MIASERAVHETELPLHQLGIRRQNNSISEVFKSIISNFEVTCPDNINVMNVSVKYNVQHRRVYDLFNLLTALGTCKSVERGRLKWIGKEEAFKTIEAEYAKIEEESLEKDIGELFALGPSPSLGDIAKRFLTLFPFLGVNRISLKQAFVLLKGEMGYDKSLERRVYLVLAILELIGLLSHSKRTGEYWIAAQDLDRIRKNVMERKRKVALSRAPTSIESNLASLDETYVRNLMKKRQEEYYLLGYRTTSMRPEKTPSTDVSKPNGSSFLQNFWKF